MSDNQAPLGFDKKLTYLLRTTDSEDAPVRSEGIDFIESTDLRQFLHAGWVELLFVTDYFFRAVIRVEEDRDFVKEWQDHGGIGGDGKELLLQRIMEVALVWRERLHAIERHHTDEGTEPDLHPRISPAYYFSPEVLGVVLDPFQGTWVKFRLLDDLTRIIIAHSSLASCRSLVETSALPKDAREGSAWLAKVAGRILITGHFSPAALLGLEAESREVIARVAEMVATSYGRELEQELREEASPDEISKRVVIIDPQLVLDVACIECAIALSHCGEAGDKGGREEFDQLLTRLKGIVNGSAGVGNVTSEGRGAQVGSWFSPSDQITRPNSIPEAEEIARKLITNVIARRGLRECVELSTRQGELIRFETRRDVILFRVPRESSRPLVGRGELAVRRAAFNRAPMLSWLLYPTAVAPADSAFWTEGLHGAFVDTMVGLSERWKTNPTAIVVRREIEEMAAGNATSKRIKELFMEGYSSQVAGPLMKMISPILGYWLEWGTPLENRLGQPTPERSD